MDEKFIGIIIIILFGALPCIVLGYLIAVKQMHGLIAGWNESKVSNPVAFGKWVGFSVLVDGLCIAGTGLVWYLGLINEKSDDIPTRYSLSYPHSMFNCCYFQV